MQGENDKIHEFKFSVQWIHSKTEYKLKRLILKANKLEEAKQKISSKFNKAKMDLEEVQNQDGTGIGKKLLLKEQTSGKTFCRSLKSLDETQTENSKYPQYLSFSESEEEEKMVKDNITT
jgi:hypothetical protein